MNFKFKESFMELKKPLLWAHYALGTILIYLISHYVLKLNYLIPGNLVLGLFAFFAAYLLTDRAVHGILGLT